MRRTRIRAGQRLVGLTATALAGVALMTGCSAEKQEASTELPSAASTSAEPTPDLPPLGPADFPVPKEARVQDEAGARAFLDYWIALLNRQRAIPEGEPLRQLGPDCEGCDRIADNYDDVATSSHSYRGGELSLNDVPNPRILGDEARIAFGVRQNAVAIIDRSGAVIDKGLPAIPNAGSGIALRWSQADSGWLVTAFDLG